MSYDPEAHAAYIKVAQGRVSKTRKEAPGVFADIGSHGQLLGVEIIEPRKIQLNLVVRIAKEFKVPQLAHFDPRALGRLYSPPASTIHA